MDVDLISICLVKPPKQVRERGCCRHWTHLPQSKPVSVELALRERPCRDNSNARHGKAPAFKVSRFAVAGCNSSALMRKAFPGKAGKGPYQVSPPRAQDTTAFGIIG
jgi:hypothetical protein